MKFRVGDLLVYVLNRNVAVFRHFRRPLSGIITSIDGERIGIRWNCYDGTSLKNHYTWHHLEELVDRKTMQWYPV